MGLLREIRNSSSGAIFNKAHNRFHQCITSALRDKASLITKHFSFRSRSVILRKNPCCVSHVQRHLQSMIISLLFKLSISSWLNPQYSKTPQPYPFSLSIDENASRTANARPNGSVPTRANESESATLSLPAPDHAVDRVSCRVARGCRTGWRRGHRGRGG